MEVSNRHHVLALEESLSEAFEIVEEHFRVENGTIMKFLQSDPRKLPEKIKRAVAYCFVLHGRQSSWISSVLKIHRTTIYYYCEKAEEAIGMKRYGQKEAGILYERLKNVS